MDVLDHPSLETIDGRTFFVRTLEMGPSTKEHVLQVLQESGRAAIPWGETVARHSNAETPHVPDPNHPPTPTPVVSPQATDRSGFWLQSPMIKSAAKRLAAPTNDLQLDGRAQKVGELESLVGPPPRDHTAPVVGIVGAPLGSRWLTDGETGNIRLAIAPHPVEMRIKLLIARGPESEMNAITTAMAQSARATPIRPWIQLAQARWPEKLTTQGRLGSEDGPYAIDELTAPEANPWNSWLRFSGIDFFRDGRRAAVSTWNGDVWVIDGIEGSLEQLRWQRIAAGLFQPLGLRIVDDEIYVLGRDQITRLRDINGDGETDFYENFNNDALVSEHFHEFANDLKLGHDGDFYYLKCARHALPAVHSQHGTLMRVSRDGQRSEVVARGFRAVNGLGIGPDQSWTTVDNQGHWMPANRINWVKPGGWYGNQWAWNPDQRSTYDKPLCWVHNFVDRSGGTHLWVPTDRWGALKDELITLSYGMGHGFLVLRDEVDGQKQGALTRLPLDFETGVMRGAFHPGNGQLYACGLYGWAGNRTKPGAVHRIRRTDKPLHLARRFHATQDGMVLEFTEPLDRSVATDPGNYDLKAWNYRWSPKYGSPDLRQDGSEGRDTWRVDSASVSADGRTIFLRVPEVKPTMQFHLVFKLRAEDGQPIENFLHGTLHRVATEPGLPRLGPSPIHRAPDSETSLRTQTPGLRQSLYAGDEPDPRDVRTVRLAAVYLPAGEAVSPFLTSHPSRIHWDGWLQLDLNESKHFFAHGRGDVRLSINGQAVWAASGDPWEPKLSHAIRLRQGLNRFELDYRPPTNGPAELRLSWSGASHPTEPVPPTAFVHDASEGRLRLFRALREGRALFADRQCAACHRPSSPWAGGSMPELSHAGPALDGVGSQWKSGALVHWLLDPRSFRKDARMPIVLTGTNALKDAHEIAGYLSALHETKPATPPDEATAETGGKLYRELGCAGCHFLPGETPLNPETRSTLDGLHDRWPSGALAAFLQSPTRRHATTRMPDFQLNKKEAASLAAFLQSRSRPPEIAHRLYTADEIRRGGELTARWGCLRCHALHGVQDASRANDLTAIARADGLRGCLATNPKDRRTAPDFQFTETERTLLREFLKSDPDSLLRHDAPVEFAERQYERLQCQACHSRDQTVDLLSALEPAKANPTPPDDEEVEGGSVHLGRPPLTYTGEKLHAAWLERLLTGTLGYKPRADLVGRMPAFPAYASGIATGLAHQHGYPAEAAPTPAIDPRLAELGRTLTLVEGGFSCVSCHGVGTQKALAGRDTATVNFAHVAERLRESYYWRYVQDPPRVMPGTMMPKFIADDGRTSIHGLYEGDPSRQFNAIWHYLQSVRNLPVTP